MIMYNVWMVLAGSQINDSHIAPMWRQKQIFTMQIFLTIQST